jgi:hypothetical protein
MRVPSAPAVALLLAVIVTSSCGSSGGGAGTSSGLPRSSTLASLTPGQDGTLCDWENDKQGGYGVSMTCAVGPAQDTDTDKASCVASVPGFGAGCPTLTVGDVEDCVNAIGTNLCAMATSPGCANINTCLAQATPTTTTLVANIPEDIPAATCVFVEGPYDVPAADMQYAISDAGNDYMDIAFVDAATACNPSAGYAFTSGVGSVSATAAVPAGSYSLAITCQNAIDDCLPTLTAWTYSD